MEMDQSQEFDAEQLRARIHENVAKRRSVLDSPAPAARPVALGGMEEADLARLRASADPTNVRFVSHRLLLGWLVVRAKTGLRRLLTPILSQQAAYNDANVRLIDLSRRERAKLQTDLHLVSQRHAQVREGLETVIALTTRQTEEIARRHATLQDELRGVSQSVEELVSRQAELQAKVDGTHAQALQTTRERISRAERKLRRMLHALTDGESGSGSTVSAPRAMPVRLLEPDFDYAGFEERVRGSEDAIKARQRPYLEHFKGRERILEIGCGRGEFLELLREAGVPAKGVDLDLDMTLSCREKGLDVVREDALAYLESLPDDSLGGVFAAQVIEHLETSQLTRLVSLCHRKLRPEGVLVLETLNPECLLVLYRWFWIDLSHTRLVHPETLKFLFESAGFGRVERRFLPLGDAPVTIPPLEIRGLAVPELARFNAATDYLNKLLYASSDYAVIGTK
jgi:SAM-dependent methyltransferase